MDVTFDEWDRGFSPLALDEIAGLWNANAGDRHAFFPWSGRLLAAVIGGRDSGAGRIIAARDADGSLAGFVHVARVRENGYPGAGVIEMLLVDSRRRGAGIGTALLRKAVHLLAAQPDPPGFVDAMGAWPFGYIYNTLADGSERSGVFLREEGLYRLFSRAGFEPVRKSYVMRAGLDGLPPSRPLPPGSDVYRGARVEATWLDRVFRGRELWDHDLCLAGGALLSRAIYGRMEGESQREGRGVYSLFGVNTPHDRRGRGYAGVNLSRLMHHVRGLGGDVMELHVYTDNEPALALYTGLGFKAVAETAIMHLRL